MNSTRLDPYLLWALLRGRLLLTQRSTDGDPSKEFRTVVAVTVEVLDPTQPVRPDDGSAENRFQSFYPSHSQDAAAPTRFRTGWVTFAGLGALVGNSLSIGSNVKRFEVGLTTNGDSFYEALLANASVAPNDRNKLPYTAGASQVRSQPLVCVIDDRCNFSNSGLRSGTSSRTRIQQIWVQAVDRATLRKLELSGVWDSAYNASGGSFIRGSWSGKRLRPNDIHDFDLAREPLPYRQAEYMRNTPSASHGAAVVNLIAGNSVWIGDKLHQGRIPPDNVHFVQLPVSTVVNTHGGSLGLYVIDGLRDALQVADDDQDVVANVSFGTHSGAHDGTSLFDGALLELLERYDGRAPARGKRLHVVLPAGNSHLWRCHASGFLVSGAPQPLDWKVQPDDDSDNFVEIWIPRNRRVRLSVTLPGESSSHVIELSSNVPTPRRSVLLYSTQGDIVGALFASTEPPQSEHSAMFLVVAGASLSLDTKQYEGRKRSIDDYISVLDSRREVAVGRERASLTTRSPAPVASSPNSAPPTPPGQAPDIPKPPVLPPEPEPLPDEPLSVPIKERIATTTQFEQRGFRWRTKAPQFGATPAPAGAPGLLSPALEDSTKSTGFVPVTSPMHGVWQMTLELLDTDESVQWHAWVQRGDTAPMRQRSARGILGRQSYFVDNGRTPVDPSFTMNGIATAVHKRLYVVGAMQRNDGNISDYSGSGPARHAERPCGPDVVVPADESRRLQGLRVQGVYSGSSTRLSGTSMAAPVFARMLYEHLCKHPSSDGSIFAVSPENDTVPPKVPEGAPKHACPFNRGDPNRILPSNPDGSL